MLRLRRLIAKSWWLSRLAAGKEIDGNPSLRYLTPLRDGARTHGLPEHWIKFLESVKHAE